MKNRSFEINGCKRRGSGVLLCFRSASNLCAVLSVPVCNAQALGELSRRGEGRSKYSRVCTGYTKLYLEAQQQSRQHPHHEEDIAAP